MCDQEQTILQCPEKMDDLHTPERKEPKKKKEPKAKEPKAKEPKAKKSQEPRKRLNVQVTPEPNPSDSMISTPFRATPPMELYHMCLTIDVREPEVWEHCLSIYETQHLTNDCIPQIQSKTLLMGDIEVRNAAGEPMVMVERKTIADLIASIKDGRYTEQAYRLHHASSLHAHNIIYIIEGTISSKNPPAITKMIKSALISLQLFKGFSIVRTNTVAETAGYIMEMATRMAVKQKEGIPLFFPNRGTKQTHATADTDVNAVDVDACEREDGEREETEYGDTGDMRSSGGGKTYASVIKASKKQNITYQNIHAVMLSQIPGISPQVAEQLLDGKTLEEFIQRLRKGDRWLFDLKIETARAKRALSKSVVQSIYLYFFNTPPPRL